jgi:hypothetical protein
MTRTRKYLGEFALPTSGGLLYGHVLCKHRHQARYAIAHARTNAVWARREDERENGAPTVQLGEGWQSPEHMTVEAAEELHRLLGAAIKTAKGK